MIHVFDDGLLEDKATNQLMAKAMTQGLRIFIEVLMGWMKHYPYEPRAVELSFGQKDSLLPPGASPSARMLPSYFRESSTDWTFWRGKMGPRWQ